MLAGNEPEPATVSRMRDKFSSMRSSGGVPPASPAADGGAVAARLAVRLAGLRVERDWSLDELAQRVGVSRSTLSRLERAQISPTAALLGRLCAASGLSMSRLLAAVETEPGPLLRAAEQEVWTDETSGFVRRSVSPPHAGLRAEVIDAPLRPGADIGYDDPPVLAWSSTSGSCTGRWR